MLCLGELSLQHKAAQEQHFHGSVMKSQPPSSIQQCWPQPVKIRRPHEKRYNSLENKTADPTAAPDDFSVGGQMHS